MALPRPISLVSIGIFLGVGLIWVPTIILLFSPSMTSPATWMIILGVPIGASIIGNKPWFDGKNIFDFILSQVSYFQEPQAWSDMVDEKELEGQGYEIKQFWWKGNDMIEKKGRKNE